MDFNFDEPGPPSLIITRGPTSNNFKTAGVWFYWPFVLVPFPTSLPEPRHALKQSPVTRGLQQRCGVPVGVHSHSTSLSASFWTYGMARFGAMETPRYPQYPQTPLLQGTLVQVASYILALLHLH